MYVHKYSVVVVVYVSVFHYRVNCAINSLSCSALHEREQKEKLEANHDDDLFKDRLAHIASVHMPQSTSDF